MDGLRKLQLELLDVVKQFQGLCEEYGLSYYPIDGTLLGLVRHGGFIPWDDDVDIAMPRDDFERLAAVLHERIPSGMHYRYFKEMSDGAKDIQYGIRLYSSNAKTLTKFYGAEEIEDVNIDIFPLDGMPAGKLRYALFKFELLSIKMITKLSQINNVRTFLKRPLIDRMLIRVGKTVHLDKVLNTKKWYSRMDRTLKKYNYSSAETVGVFWSDYRFHEMVPKYCYEPAKLRRFEDIELPCPARPEVILEKLYGDWKNPPPDGPHQKHPIKLIESTVTVVSGPNTNAEPPREAGGVEPF